jgi:hypothetical protein
MGTLKEVVDMFNRFHPLETFANLDPVCYRRGWLETTRIGGAELVQDGNEAD